MSGTTKNGTNDNDTKRSKVFRALDRFRIEILSWGFANTGTRFGKFAQAAAANTLDEKFADAGEVNRLTGCTPTVALHVLWDMPNGAGGSSIGGKVRRPRWFNKSERLPRPRVQIRVYRKSQRCCTEEGD